MRTYWTKGTMLHYGNAPNTVPKTSDKPNETRLYNRAHLHFACSETIMIESLPDCTYCQFQWLAKFSLYRGACLQKFSLILLVNFLPGNVVIFTKTECKP